MTKTIGIVTSQEAAFMLVTLLFIAATCAVMLKIYKQAKESLPSQGLSSTLLVSVAWMFLSLFILYSLAYCVPSLLEKRFFEALEGILQSIYAIVLTISIQAPTPDVSAVVLNHLPDHQFVRALGMFYSMLLVLLCIATPLCLVTAVVSKAREVLSNMQVILSRKYCKNAYLFAGVGEGSIALAKSILKESKEDDSKGNSLIIFCGVSIEERDDNTAALDDVRDKSGGGVIVTSRTLSVMIESLETGNVIGNIKFPRHRFERIHCIALGDNCTENVESAIGAIETITNLVKLANTANTDSSNEDAKRYNVYCLHDSQENELVFDSLVHGKSASGEPILSDEDLEIRKNIGVRLISRSQEQAMSLLTRNPLFGVLDKVDANNPQQLYVIVVGLGSYGLEILKASYWMGRMIGVDLHVWGIDSDGDHIRDVLETTCPEMMEEKGRDGNPVVKVMRATPFTSVFKQKILSLPKDSRVYAVSSLEGNELNLSVALMMRRLFDDMLRTGAMTSPKDVNKDRSEFPIILPLISSKEFSEAADRMTSDEREAFRLEPFGRADEVFSYHSIIDSVWEKRALAMNAAYREVHGKTIQSRGISAVFDVDDIAREYAEFEIKKLSNRANVRHIPYRLWSMGLIAEANELRFDGHCTSLTNERWHRLLGIGDSDDVGRLLMQYWGSEGDDAKRCEKDGIVRGNESQMKGQQDAIRTKYPEVHRLAELEHDRWVAFYRSKGWRGMTLEDCKTLENLGVIRDYSVHQSPKLRLHYYLCSNEELLERGVEIGEDPYAFNRAAVIETQRILTGSILNNWKGEASE